MTVRGTVGSSLFTRRKNEILRKILKVNLESVYNIQKRYPNWANSNYVYVDLNAGDGRPYDDGISKFNGSVQTFIELARTYTETNSMNCTGIFVEIDPTSCSILEHSLTTHRNNWNLWNIHATVFNMSNDDFLKLPSDQLFNIGDITGKLFGLIYCDPNNGDTPLVELSETLKRPECRYLDVLINRNCTAAKRLNGYNPGSRETLFELVEMLPKDFWFIREPETPHQFSLILGTNSKRLPRFKSLGFHNIKSRQGKMLMNYLSYPKKTIFPIN